MSFSERQFQEHFGRLVTLYRRERQQQNLTEDDLKLLMLLFPGVLVAQADGFIDTTEMVELVKLTRDLAKRYDLSVSDSIKDELKFLTRNTVHWYEPIMSALKFYIAAEDKATDVADLMVLVANSSSGDLLNNALYKPAGGSAEGDESGIRKENPGIQFLSEAERQDIRRLARILGLYNHPDAAERLSLQLEETELV
jgi:hypothetical protein